MRLRVERPIRRLRLFNSNCCGAGVSAPAEVEIKEDLEGDPPVLASGEETQPNGWNEYELEKMKPPICC